jgi:hypothetical protein
MGLIGPCVFSPLNNTSVTEFLGCYSSPLLKEISSLKFDVTYLEKDCAPLFTSVHKESLASIYSTVGIVQNETTQVVFWCSPEFLEDKFLS